jgi:putative ATPase
VDHVVQRKTLKEGLDTVVPTGFAREDAQHPVPLHLRNAPTALGKELGHGKGYVYAHDTASGIAAFSCLPEDMKGAEFFVPSERGFEKKLGERMVENERLRRGKG